MSPSDEAARLALLKECRILDTPAEPDFDDLTRLAAQICGTPIALVSLIDETRQWFKSRVGLDATETPRRLAFCAHAILDPAQMLIVPDATKDARFAGNDLVTGEMGIRFYAGAPLVTEEGLALGTLCVIDRQARELSTGQQEALAALARQVVSQIQLRRQNFALLQAQAARDLFFNLPLDLLCIAGTDGFFKLLNPAFTEALGYSMEELLGSSFLAFIHPDDVAATRRELERLGKGPTTLNFENRYRRKDGAYLWLSWKCTPMPDGMLYASARDITERKRVEEKLRALSELQRGILDSAAYAVIAGTPEGIITEFNPAAERMLGYSAEEMVGRRTPAIFHDPEEVVARAKEFSAELGAVIEPGFEVFVAKARRRQPNEHEWTYLRKDGSRFPVQLSVTALWDGPEKIVGFLGLAIDITERRRAQEKLLALSEMQRGILDSTAYSVIATTTEGVITEFNPAAERLLGYSAEEMVGRATPKIFHILDEVVRRAEEVSAELGVVLLPGFESLTAKTRRRLPNEHEWTFVRKDGSHFPAQLSITGLWDDAGNITGFLGVFIDITERHEAERRLKASIEEKEALLQEIHHRVKNNLQVVSSLLSLESGYIEDPRMLARFQECRGRIRSMALIHEKLYQSESLAKVELSDYLESLARIVMSTYAAGGEVRLEAKLEPVITDIDTAVPLGLLVNELLSNALKYAFPERRGGTVFFSLQPDGENHFTLTVGDDGAGLPAGFHLARSKTLGMRLVGMFAKQLRGELVIHSQPGQTTFSIRCPGALSSVS